MSTPARPEDTPEDTPEDARPDEDVPPAGSPGGPQPEGDEPPVVGRAVVRRVPRYRTWVLTGVLLGVVVAVLVVLLGPEGPGGGLGRGPVVVFLALLGVLVCGLLGALLAVLVERARR
jgi:hypothetical protein